MVPKPEVIRTYAKALYIILGGFFLFYKNEPITIAGKDGDDARTYIEKEVNRKLEMLKTIENQESEK